MFGKEAFTASLNRPALIVYLNVRRLSLQLGYLPEDGKDNRLTFKYTISAGRFKDAVLTVGIEVPPDFNVTCPSGPHISPRLIPINPNAPGNDRSAESPNFGSEWQYLSRPFVDQQAGWNRTSRNVKAN